jgi:RNA polymerase sigma-70 factor, ECF subfamily
MWVKEAIETASRSRKVQHTADDAGRNGPTDADLVARAQAGDAAAFAALIGRYERMALAVAYAAAGTSRDGERAADLVQEAFVRAWSKLHTLQEPSRFAAWLANIIRNVAADQRRRARVRHEQWGGGYGLEGASERDGGHGDALSALAAEDADPALEAEAAESRDRVGAALARLDEVTRSAVVLRYYENCTSRQIAEVLGLSPAAVDMRLMRGRQELKRLLGEALAEADARERPVP